jgi:DNA primase
MNYRRGKKCPSITGVSCYLLLPSIGFLSKERSLNGDAGSPHWRLPNERFKVGSGLFNFNSRTEEVIRVEGVFDALALLQNGFSHGVATFGTQGLKDQHRNLFKKSRTQKVFVCYDNDASGRAAAVRDDFALEDAGKEVRIVKLPEDTDPNEFILVHSPDDLRGLVDSALHPFDHQVEQIRAVEPREKCLKGIRDELLPRVMQADPITQPELVKRIHEGLNVPVKALYEQLKVMREQEASQKKDTEPLEVGVLTTVNPALDFIGDTALIMLHKESWTWRLGFFIGTIRLSRPAASAIRLQ